MIITIPRMGLTIRSPHKPEPYNKRINIIRYPGGDKFVFGHLWLFDFEFYIVWRT